MCSIVLHSFKYVQIYEMPSAIFLCCWLYSLYFPRFFDDDLYFSPVCSFSPPFHQMLSTPRLKVVHGAGGPGDPSQRGCSHPRGARRSARSRSMDSSRSSSSSNSNSRSESGSDSDRPRSESHRRRSRRRRARSLSLATSEFVPANAVAGAPDVHADTIPAPAAMATRRTHFLGGTTAAATD